MAMDTQKANAVLSLSRLDQMTAALEAGEGSEEKVRDVMRWMVDNANRHELALMLMGIQIRLENACYTGVPANES